TAYREYRTRPLPRRRPGRPLRLEAEGTFRGKEPLHVSLGLTVLTANEGKAGSRPLIIVEGNQFGGQMAVFDPRELAGHQNALPFEEVISYEQVIIAASQYLR